MSSAPKILVIDDDETILMQVEAILKKNGYTSVCTDNGRDGLEKASTEQPNAIILDSRMPEMDGSETLAKLKANKGTTHIPVIMLTGNNKITDVQASFERGVNDYIVKPFKPEDILNSLKRALEQDE